MTSPQPAALKPVSGLGIAASVLIGVATLGPAGLAYATWNTRSAVSSFLAGPRTDDAALQAADQLAQNALIVIGTTLLVAAIMVIGWLWRARTNAERRQPAVRHRFKRGWVIGGWICPVVNLWFPFQVVGDVWRASGPDPRPDEIAHEAPMPLVRAWWACVLGYVVLNRIAAWTIPNTVAGLTPLAIVTTVGAVLVAAAAVLLILVIRQISAWQSGWLGHGVPAGQHFA